MNVTMVWYSMWVLSHKVSWLHSVSCYLQNVCCGNFFTISTKVSWLHHLIVNVLPSNACCCADFSTISWKVSWLHHLIVNVFTFKCLLLCRFLYNLMEGLMTGPPHCQCVYLQMLVVVQISLQSHGRSHDSTTSLSMCLPSNASCCADFSTISLQVSLLTGHHWSKYFVELLLSLNKFSTTLHYSDIVST